MTYERWEQVRELVRGRFGISKEGKEDLSPGPGQVEFLECNSPAGNMRLELEIRPRVAEKKTYYSKRMGATSTVEYKYDPNEVVLQFKAFRFDPVNQEWVSINSDAVTGSLVN